MGLYCDDMTARGFFLYLFITNFYIWCFDSKPIDVNILSFLYFKMERSVPLTWGRLEGAAMLFCPPRWVEAWVEVKKPEGSRCVREALCAYQTQFQPPSNILLHLSSPGQAWVNTVLELHIAACAQELHWVSTALGLREEWWGVVNEKLIAQTHTYTNTNEHTPRQGKEFVLGENVLHD